MSPAALHGLAAVGIVICAVGGLRLGAAGHLVTFRAADGRNVQGLMVEASQRPAPAVVLVPMLGRPKDDWQAIAQRLADANITALSVDLPPRPASDDAGMLERWSADVRAALSYLAGRPDVRPDALGMAGASLGATLAAAAAAADPAVRALVLISPSLDYRGVRLEAPLRAYGVRPALLIASLRDPYAARTVRELAKGPPGPRDAHWAETPAHGLVLLNREPDLVRILVEWFQRTLGVQ